MRSFASATMFILGLTTSGTLASPPVSPTTPPTIESIEGPRGKVVRTVSGTARMDVKTGLLWVWVSPGSFLFGCDDEKSSKDDNPMNAKTQKAVVDGFWMTRSRVTNAEYAACVDAGACTARGREKWCAAGPSYPATCVNFLQAQSFCQWVGGKIPTDKEWEYVADSGYDMNWEFGTDFNGTDNGASEWVLGKPTPVEAGYERTRGGIADLAPLFRCDNGNAWRELQSQRVGFRCVQAVDRR